MMSENDKRLNYIQGRVDAHAFHNARADMPYLLGLVKQLRVQCKCLAHDCQELEDSREYNAGLVIERDAEIAALRQQLATVTDLVPEVDLMKRAADYALCTAAARHQPIAPGVQEDADHRTLIMLAARIRAWRGDGGEEREGESDGD